MPLYKTPGVYITEQNAFPHSVAEVETAIPAFVGYTEQTHFAGASLLDTPRRITSMADFEACFGVGPSLMFAVEALDPASGVAADIIAGGKDYVVRSVSSPYLLYRSLRLFFANGGGACYVVSVGDYSTPINADRLCAGIAALERQREVTLLVIPETTCLDATGSGAVHRAMLAHCGGTMKNRVAVLDIRNGDRPRKDPSGDCVADFRDAVGSEYLSYGAAYYPWLHTTVVSADEVTYASFEPAARLQVLLREELGVPEVVDAGTPATIRPLAVVIDDIALTWEGASPADTAAKQSEINQSLLAISPLYRQLRDVALRKLNLLPPAAAMAGLYTMVDNSRGVWKSPANIGVNATTAPAVAISHEEQEDLNVDARTGKSVNAIRSFIGEGVLVWGARTLAGNDNEWRYVSVRRTVIMLEESIQRALRAFVFEPNDANTWAGIRSMISNFLTEIWKRGGLAGAAPDEAFGVRVGLGDTMTAQDIQEDRLRVVVFVALIRPAEFIVLDFVLKITSP